MSKLWIFGDSFSDSCGLYDSHLYASWLTTHTDIVNPLEYSWQYLLAKELDLKLEGRAISGSGNTEIITEILANINYIDKNDFIIIGWSVPTRLSLPGEGSWKKFTTISNYMNAKNLDDDLGGTRYYDFYTNTFPEKIDYHVEYWNNIGMELSFHLQKNYNIITWSWLHEYRSIQTISHHTNNEVGDDHPSIEGHKYIFEKLKSSEWGTIFDLNTPDELVEHTHKP